MEVEIASPSYEPTRDCEVGEHYVSRGSADSQLGGFQDVSIAVVTSPSADGSKVSLTSQRSYDSTGEERKPGAFSSSDRPIGARPAWQRPQTASNTNRDASQSNVPPEMRTQVSQSNVPPEMRTQVSQSDVPPEMRTVVSSPVPAELANPAPSEEERQQALPVNSSSSGRRRSSRFSSLLFGGDAQVATAEELDEKKFRKETWAVVCCVMIVIAVAVGVVLAATSPDCTDCDVISPTEAPTSSSSDSPRLVQLRDALMHLSPDPSVLQDPTTPQYHALLWMADHDKAAIDVEDTRRLEVRYALAALYYATNGNNWIHNLGFLSPEHECEWFVEKELEDNTTVVDGVLCDEEDQVVGIKLDGNGLLGSMSPEQKALSSLRLLNLASNRNKVSGVSIPGLVASDTFGVIAEIGGGLTSLILSDNVFGSTIPTVLGTLSNLQTLYLDQNQFTGTLPRLLSRLSNLEELNLYDNRLNGAIEDVVENLLNLTRLRADDNDFSISPQLRFPPSLEFLRLDRNQFDGSPLTSSIGRLSQLEALSLSRMNIVGSLPTELGMITNLEVLDLSSNQLGGNFPWSAVNATALRRLSISACDLTGQLPSDIGRFSSMEFLDVSRNFLGGSIPESIGNMTSLVQFAAHSNFLIGPIPSTIGQLTSLQQLSLDSNELTGSLPNEMVNMTSLSYLALSSNEFIGGDIEFICGRDYFEVVSRVDPSAGINCSCCQFL